MRRLAKYEEIWYVNTVSTGDRFSNFAKICQFFAVGLHFFVSLDEFFVRFELTSPFWDVFGIIGEG